MIVSFLILAALPASAAAPPPTLGLAVRANIAVSTLEPPPRGAADGRPNGQSQRILAAQKRYATGKVIEPERLTTK